MAKGQRRNAKPTHKPSVYTIKALASYHGNLCVHLQDADTSNALENALGSLKIDDAIDENLEIGKHVLVARSESGEIKFRRAAVDILKGRTLDATDLDTNEYYCDVHHRSVYRIGVLGNRKLIEAEPAEPYYVHGFHTDSNLINPKHLDKVFKQVKPLRWLMQKTGENHATENEVPVIKLTTEKHIPFDKVVAKTIKVVPRQEAGMPPLFYSSTEEVRVVNSGAVMGVQLRYLPLHELNRLEVSMSEAFEAETFKCCEWRTTAQGDLVAALHNNRRVRGCVVDVRPSGAEVYLMDYGKTEKFRYQKLWKLWRDLAFKLPRYGLRVKLPEEPDDFFDDCSVEVNLSGEVDDCTAEGEIVKPGEDNLEELVDDPPAESEGSDHEQDNEEARPQSVLGGDDDDDAQGGDSACGSSPKPEAVPQDLVKYLGSTDQAFVPNADDISLCSGQRKVAGSVVESEAQEELSTEEESVATVKDNLEAEPKEEAANPSDDPSPAVPTALDEDHEGDSGSVSVPEAEDVDRPVNDAVGSSEEPLEVQQRASSGDAAPGKLSEVGASPHQPSGGSGDVKEELPRADDLTLGGSGASPPCSRDSEKTVEDHAVDPIEPVPEESPAVEDSTDESRQDGGKVLEVDDCEKDLPEVPLQSDKSASPLADIREHHDAPGDRKEEVGAEAQTETEVEHPNQEVEDVVSPPSERSVPVGEVSDVAAPDPEEDLNEPSPSEELEQQDDKPNDDLPDPPPVHAASGGTLSGSGKAEEILKIEEPSAIQAQHEIASPEQSSQVVPESSDGRAEVATTTEEDEAQVPNILVPKQPGNSAAQPRAKASHNTEILEDLGRRSDPVLIVNFCCSKAPAIPERIDAPSTVAAVAKSAPCKRPTCPIGKTTAAERAEPVPRTTKVLDSAISAAEYAAGQFDDAEDVPSVAVHQEIPVVEDILEEHSVMTVNEDDISVVSPPTGDTIESDPLKVEEVETVPKDELIDEILGSGDAQPQDSDAVVPLSGEVSEEVQDGLTGGTVASAEVSETVSSDNSWPQDCKSTEHHEGSDVQQDPETHSMSEVPRVEEIPINTQETTAGDAVVGTGTDASPESDDSWPDPSNERRVEQTGIASDEQTSSQDEPPVPEVPTGSQTEKVDEDVAKTAIVEAREEDDGSRPDPSKELRVESTDNVGGEQTDPQVVPPVPEVPALLQVPAAVTPEKVDEDVAKTVMVKAPEEDDSWPEPDGKKDVENEGIADDTQKEKVVDQVAEVKPTEDERSSEREVGDKRGSQGTARGVTPVPSKEITPPVQRGSDQTKGRNVAKAEAGPSTTAVPPGSKADAGVRKVEGPKVPQEDLLYTNMRPTPRVRDFCEYPQLTFATGKVLVGRVNHIVNERHLLMTHEENLANIEKQLNAPAAYHNPETHARPDKIVLVKQHHRWKRACVISLPKSGTTEKYLVYLLDYPEVVKADKLYVCPPAIAAIPRSLLFVRVMTNQRTMPEWVGHKYRLAVDRFEGSTICALVLRIPDVKYPTA